jgi:hypothetical protein
MDDAQCNFRHGSRWHRLSLCLVAAIAALIGIGLWRCFTPQELDLSTGPITHDEAPRDLRKALEHSLKRGEPVAFSQEEINRWLHSKLATVSPSTQTTADRTVVRLLDGYAEVVMRRQAIGMPFTVSMFLRIERRPDGTKQVHRHGGPYTSWLPHPLRGGRFGRLTVPQGFLLLAMPAFSRLAQSLRDDIRLAFEDMSVIRIEPGRLVLDPLEPQTGNPSPSIVF